MSLFLFFFSAYDGTVILCEQPGQLCEAEVRLRKADRLSGLRQRSRLLMKVLLHWLRVRNLVLGGLNQEEGDVTGFKSPMRKGKSVRFF